MTTPGKVQDGDAGTRLHMSGHFGCSASPLQNVEPIEDVVSCACDIDIAGMFSSSVTQMGFETFSVGLRDFWVTRGPTLVGCEISDWENFLNAFFGDICMHDDPLSFCKFCSLWRRRARAVIDYKSSCAFITFLLPRVLRYWTALTCAFSNRLSFSRSLHSSSSRWCHGRVWW